jgi:hypothetical protein
VIYKVLLHTVSGNISASSVHIDMALWLLHVRAEYSQLKASYTSSLRPHTLVA